MGRVLDDGGLRSHLVENAYARVSTGFLREHTGLKYESIFARLIPASRSTSSPWF